MTNPHQYDCHDENPYVRFAHYIRQEIKSLERVMGERSRLNRADSERVKQLREDLADAEEKAREWAREKKAEGDTD